MRFTPSISKVFVNRNIITSSRPHLLFLPSIQVLSKGEKWNLWFCSIQCTKHPCWYYDAAVCSSICLEFICIVTYMKAVQMITHLWVKNSALACCLWLFGQYHSVLPQKRKKEVGGGVEGRVSTEEQEFNATVVWYFFFPASFTFFTVLTCSPFVARENSLQLFFSLLFLVSAVLIFAASFTQTLSIPFMRWQTAQEVGIMCVTSFCPLLLTCFPLLWIGFLHILRSFWSCAHPWMGCPRVQPLGHVLALACFVTTTVPSEQRDLHTSSGTEHAFSHVPNNVFPHLSHAPHVSPLFLLLPAADALSLTCLHRDTLCSSNSCSFRSWRVPHSGFRAG